MWGTVLRGGPPQSPERERVSIESLLRERDGYVLRGLPDRVAQVDAELAKLGYETETAVVGAPETAAVVRRGRPKKTQDAPAGP